MYGLRGLNINLTGETLCGGFGSKWRCKAEIKRKIILRNNLRQDFVTCCPPQHFRARGHPSSSPEPRPHSATPQTLRERCPEQRGRFKGLQGARMTRAGEQDVEREGRCSAGSLLSFWLLQLLRELKYVVPTQQGTESSKLTKKDAVTQTELPKNHAKHAKTPCRRPGFGL